MMWQDWMITPLLTILILFGAMIGYMILSYQRNKENNYFKKNMKGWKILKGVE